MFGLALGAQPEVLVPVEFQCGGQVVDLGQAEVLGAHAGLGVGGVEDVVLEHSIRCGHHGRRVGGDIGKLRHGLRVVRGGAGHCTHRRHTGQRPEMLLGECLARHDQRGRTIGGGADVEQPKRIGDHRAGRDVLDRGFLAVARIRVGQAMPGVLHLHVREVLRRRAVEVHPAPGQQGEVHGVGGTDQVEALPVRIITAFPADRGEEPLRGGVGTDHQCDVAHPGQDLRAGGLQGLGTRRARRVTRRHRDAGPPELLGERRTGDEARVAVADGVRSGDELNLAPIHPGVAQGGAGGDDAVLGEVASPLAPRVHACAEDVHGLDHQAILQA